MRKIVQISCSQVEHNNDLEVAVSALCDDGTVWIHTTNSEHFEWKAVPAIPQHEIDDLGLEISDGK